MEKLMGQLDGMLGMLHAFATVIWGQAAQLLPL